MQRLNITEVKRDAKGPCKQETMSWSEEGVDGPAKKDLARGIEPSTWRKMSGAISTWPTGLSQQRLDFFYELSARRCFNVLRPELP
jgi:hypothetical protein